MRICNYDLIMCSDQFSKQTPDESYRAEYEAAKKLTNVHLFDVLDISSLTLPAAENKKLIYHGWMMPLGYYDKFYHECKKFGYELVNDPSQYAGCHHFQNWYLEIKEWTPKSTIVPIADIRTMSIAIRDFMSENSCGVIIKDQVKSIKHCWYEACFIPANASFFHIVKVVTTFMKIKAEADDLRGDLVVRQFVNLKEIGRHNKSGMPLAQEFRTFVLNGEIVATYNYWEQGKYDNDRPSDEFLNILAKKIYNSIGSNLFTIDVAQMENGKFTCIEVGDGQVSAVPEQVNRLEFFSKLLGDKT